MNPGKSRKRKNSRAASAREGMSPSFSRRGTGTVRIWPSATIPGVYSKDEAEVDAETLISVDNYPNEESDVEFVDGVPVRSAPRVHDDWRD